MTQAVPALLRAAAPGGRAAAAAAAAGASAGAAGAAGAAEPMQVDGGAGLAAEAESMGGAPGRAQQEQESAAQHAEQADDAIVPAELAGSSAADPGAGTDAEPAQSPLRSAAAPSAEDWGGASAGGAGAAAGLGAAAGQPAQAGLEEGQQPVEGLPEVGWGNRVKESISHRSSASACCSACAQLRPPAPVMPAYLPAPVQ